MKSDIPTSNKPHYVALDGLRGVAAIAVMVGHYLVVFLGYDTIDNPLAHSFLAVDFFFCLSGFVIAYAYDGRLKQIGVKRFFINRLIRLHPLVVIGSIIGMVAYAIAPFEENTFASEWKSISIALLLSLFMIPFPFLKRKQGSLFGFNGPAWSLFFEYFANVVYAIVLSRITRKWLIMIGALSMAFLIYQSRKLGWIEGGWGLSNYMEGFARISFSFTAGLLIYHYRIICRHKFGFILPCILLIGTFFIPHYPKDYILEQFVVILVLPAIVCIGAGTTTVGIFDSICNLLGRISYPLYMTHMTMVTIFTNYEKTHKSIVGTSKEIIIAISLIVFSLLFAYTIMRWVDEPVRKWLTKVYRQKG